MGLLNAPCHETNALSWQRKRAHDSDGYYWRALDRNHMHRWSKPIIHLVESKPSPFRYEQRRVLKRRSKRVRFPRLL
ncbi:hypothetical protein IC582_023350 [Cucumis melo]